MKLFKKKDAPQLITIGILILSLISIMDQKNKIRKKVKDLGKDLSKDIMENVKDIKIPEIENENLLIPEDKANISNLGSSIANSIGITQTNVFA